MLHHVEIRQCAEGYAPAAAGQDEALEIVELGDVFEGHGQDEIHFLVSGVIFAQPLSTQCEGKSLGDVPGRQPVFSRQLPVERHLNFLPGVRGGAFRIFDAFHLRQSCPDILGE